MSAREIKYDAIVKSVALNQYGYYVVTFSAEPGLDYPVTLCDNGLEASEAVALAGIVLTAQTGRRVKQ